MEMIPQDECLLNDGIVQK